MDVTLPYLWSIINNKNTHTMANEIVDKRELEVNQ